MNKREKDIRIAAVGDLHMKESLVGFYKEMFQGIESVADVLLLCGDLTDNGMPQEAEMFAKEIDKIKIPKLAVLGNHDFASFHEAELENIFENNGITILNGDIFQIADVGFTGTKGFGGGFGQHMLTAFGESAIKEFVDSAMDEVEKLEIGLSKLQHVQKKVVLLHYSPIAATNKGEPLEIYPFLGNSRLEEVIDTFDVSLTLHGHAHYGSLHGKTGKGADVYNVALPVLKRFSPHKPYKIIELV